MEDQSDQNRALVLVKLLHTAVWFFFASCIVAIPVAVALGRFRWVVVLSGLVLLECVVLAFNRGRCPLTEVAGRYSDSRADNFDIYLPVWLARYNKLIFGSLFISSELFAVWQWWKISQ